jgi:hypothetical protein
VTIRSGPYFHSNPDVDVAVFQVERIDAYTPVIELGGHLDDWLGRSDFVLWEVVILGYPPIPLARYTQLFAARGEVNAQIDLTLLPHVHFILSSTPRGGFSGGVVLLQGGYALGITQSLITNNNIAELGYMTAVSIEPIFECLAQHQLLPEVQAEWWDGLWNRSSPTAEAGGQDSEGTEDLEAPS